MEYRLAEKSDIDDVVKLIKAAIVQMEADGIYQWDDIYPCLLYTSPSPRD